MGFIKLPTLKANDSVRTRAAELTLRQSLWPISLVTVLFFLWGFSYGLLDTLNKHFQNELHITRARSAGLQAAYFGAYPLASLGHANYILRHYGYKLVFIWGLSLYGVGALIAWPCILNKSFGGFCAAIFVIGNGLGSLETAANPYITVCGPPRYAELRINISQAFNGVGTVVAPVLGAYAIFLHTGKCLITGHRLRVGEDEQALHNTQWIYLAIACFVFLLAIVFLFSNIPEITDADMAFQEVQTHGDTDQKPIWKQYRLYHAAFAQFCYTGAQVGIAGYFINYVTETRPNTSSSLGSKFLAGAQGAFALGRFVGCIIMKQVKPRKVFLVFITMCIVFIAPSITQRDNTGMAMLYVTLFFESICFPTIVALGMRGLGKHTKRGSGWIVAGVCGGAVVPPILGAAADANNSTATAMSVPLAFFVAAWTYALCVNFVPAYRTPVDSLGNAKIGIENTGNSDEENSPERQEQVSEDEKTEVHTTEDIRQDRLSKEIS